MQRHRRDDGADVVHLGQAGVGVCMCPTTERDLGDGLGFSRELADAVRGTGVVGEHHRRRLNRAVVAIAKKAEEVGLDVFALGDCARPEDQDLPQLAHVAEQQGKYLGDVLNRRAVGRSSGPFALMLNDGCSRMPASAGTSRAISGIDSLSELTWRLNTGFVRYCLTAPSIDSEVSDVRSASLSMNTVSSLTETPPDSALTANAGSVPRKDTCVISIE